jgi:DNA-binding transcriptional LysR family regulator
VDRLEAMQTFGPVVESGSFSTVASKSGAPRSGISKQLAALEGVRGARLLSRTTRSLALAEEAELYLEQDRRLAAEVAEAESAA